MSSSEEQSSITAATSFAHRHALRAELLRWQIGHDVERERLRLELAAVTAELDRLRGLTEVRVGQRVRQIVSRAGRRADGDAQSGEGTKGVAADARGSDGEPAGLGYPPTAIPGAVVTVRNRPEALAATLATLDRLGVVDVQIVDNASSEPTLVDALDRQQVPVHRLEHDFGPDAPWICGAMADALVRGNVLEVTVTSRGVALPTSTCPDDVIDRMVHELDRHPETSAIELARELAGEPAADRPSWAPFRLVRAASAARPDGGIVLDAPYVSAVVRFDGSSERYAQLHDDPTDDA